MAEKSVTVDDLRSLADVIESLPYFPKCDIALAVHSASTIESVSLVASLMEEVQAKQNKGTHWIQGFFKSIRVTAFYPAGLLGATRKKKAVIVDSEIVADLSRLKVVVAERQKAGQP
jgi:hypothetical protein